MSSGPAVFVWTLVVWSKICYEQFSRELVPTDQKWVSPQLGKIWLACFSMRGIFFRKSCFWLQPTWKWSMLLFQPVPTFVIIATIPYLCVVKDSKKIYSGVLLDKPSVQDILLLRLLILFWPCWFEIIWFKVGIGLERQYASNYSSSYVM